MLDDFQDDDDNNNETSSFLDELDGLGLEDIAEEKTFSMPKSQSKGAILFGMTPAQRFVVALEFFILAFVLASICLLIFNKINPPI